MRARAVFDAALELAAHERAAFVQRACADDPQVRAEVESLLLHHRDASQTALSLGGLRRLTVSSREPSLAGRRLGKYTLQDRLGAGGMGQVYRATQESPRRTVALKIVRRVFSSAEAVRRFQYEIELLGSLSHPGIAQIYEAGVERLGDENVPFFAMEYLEDAKSIVDYASSRGASLRERVELLARVCDAVHHGHQRGIVHRDLKPENILVDSAGVPKVIDFGVAISTNSDVALTTMHTHAGDLLGTLAYMSPEQCEADPKAIDTRSDVYALGVVLYELLCGRLPYEVPGTSVVAATRVICQEAPIRPSTVHRRLRGDLETIVLKALEKDRAKRYPSAEALGADLRRHLRGERIGARPPTAWSRALGWIGRRPALATTLACLAIASAALASTWTALRLVAGRPYEVAISADRGVARLNAWGGSRLHEWPPSGQGNLLEARIVDRPEPYGGGRLALLGCVESARTRAGIGEVVAYDVDRPEVALWGTADVPLGPWSPRIARAHGRFQLSAMLLADVFPDALGLELVVLLGFRPHSQWLVRIFDLAGVLRYEAWHDGVLQSVEWLSSPGLLVLSGVESQYGLGERFASREVHATTYAPCVLALKPVDGRREFRQWVVADGARLDPTLVWYETLCPSERLIALGGSFGELVEDAGAHARDAHVHVQFSFPMAGPEVLARERMPRLHFILDAQGREVDRYADDGYLAMQRSESLPDPSVFRLGPYEELPNPPGVPRAVPPAEGR